MKKRQRHIVFAMLGRQMPQKSARWKPRTSMPLPFLPEVLVFLGAAIITGGLIYAIEAYASLSGYGALTIVMLCDDGILPIAIFAGAVCLFLGGKLKTGRSRHIHCRNPGWSGTPTSRIVSYMSCAGLVFAAASVWFFVMPFYTVQHGHLGIDTFIHCWSISIGLHLAAAMCGIVGWKNVLGKIAFFLSTAVAVGILGRTLYEAWWWLTRMGGPGYP